MAIRLNNQSGKAARFKRASRRSRLENRVVDELGAAQVRLDVITSRLAALEAQGLVFEQGVHCCRERVGIVDAHCTVQADEVTRFLELIVLRTEDDLYAIDSCLVDVVEAGTASASHICRMDISVER